MRKSLLRIFATLAGATVVVAGISAHAFSSRNDLLADNNGWSDVAIEKSYAANSEIFIPNLEYLHNGKTYVAKPTVYFPNDTAYSKNTILLDQVGQYRVIYQAETPAGVFTKAYSFLAKCGSFSLTSSDSFASYGHDPLAEDITNTKNGATSPEKDGLYVHLAKGDTLTFSKYIPTTNLTIDDFIYSGYVTTSKRGSPDFDELDFLLTDADNPDIYVKIATKRRFTVDEKVGVSNTRIKANNQQYGAINYSVIYQNAGEIYGSGQIIPFAGQASYLYIDENGADKYYLFDPASNAYPFRVSLVSETMEMYNTVNFFTCTHKKGETYWEGGIQKKYDDYDFTPCLTGKERHILTDLDNPKVYGNNLFTGFPSGKAQLSISASGYNSEYASFVITSVLGMDMSNFDYADTDAPEITVDCPYEVMPEGMVGGTYPVFTATAFDEYSKSCPVKTEVYFNIDSDSPIKVPHDGNLVQTDRVGWYSIVYTSSDLNGNTATKIIRFHVGGAVEPLSFSSFDPSYGTTPIGEMYQLCPYTVSGGSGEVKVNVKATHKQTGESIEVIDSKFRPEKLGEWTIDFVAQDLVGHEEKASYPLQVVANPNTVLECDPTLPKIMISGGNYDIPRVRAFTYDEEGEKKTLTLKAKSFDQTGKEIDSFSTGGSTFAKTEQNKETIRFDFFTGSYDAGKVLASKTVDVVKDVNEQNEILLDNYFVSDGFAKVRDHVGEKLTSLLNASENSFFFANPVQSLDFGVKLQNASNGVSSFEADVTLEDSADSSLKATLHIVANGSGATISNGSKSSFVRGTYDVSSFDVTFKDGVFGLDSAKVNVDSYDDGAPFAGFPSNTVYLRVTLNNATTASSIYVRKINNHDFSYAEDAKDLTDFVAPQIFLFGVYGGHYAINEEYETNVAFVSDVISPNAEVSVTVRDPNNKKVVNGDDGTEECSITLKDYGEYRVTYQAEDAFENTVKKSFSINVSDDVAPTIVLDSEMVEKAEVNQAIAIPTFTVSDDVSQAENIAKKIYVIYPDGHKVTIPEGTASFRPTYSGKYFFHFVATDEARNTTVIERIVDVR